MKVYIGPYKSWIGPYQIADLLMYVGVSSDRCQKIGRWLSKTFVDDICQYFYRKKDRKIQIRIDRYDGWSADYTLALVILPVLQELQHQKHGAPHVDDDDVPEELKSTSAPPKKNDWDTDENWFKRWDYVLAEMIWAFESVINDDDKDSYRQQNGLILFGKYYRSLWD